MTKRFQIYTAHICAVMMSLLSVWPLQPALADTSPPIVTHELIRESVPAGSDYTLIASVTDSGPLAQVRLHFRPIASTSQFEYLDMATNGGSQFNATLRADIVVPPGLEYYITAQDAAGNSQSRGFAFDPLLLRVNAPIANAPALEPEDGGTDRRLWYVVGGLVLGAVIAGSIGEGEDIEACDPCSFGLER